MKDRPYRDLASVPSSRVAEGGGRRRIAVVGSGIAGLSVAYRMADRAQVTLYEAGDRFGGHTNTVDVTLEGRTHGVDTGFLVFNERTYPRLIALFAELGVATVASDMSFSVKAPGDCLEWSGSNLNTVFAQRRNLWRPGFHRMLADVMRFNRLATAIAERGGPATAAANDATDAPVAALQAEAQQSIAEFLDRHGFSQAFRDWYFLPMIGCIWSCPTAQMLQFPVATMIRFCHNHGLIQVSGRPRWFTVVGGAQRYVDKMLPSIADKRPGCPVRQVRRALAPASGERNGEHGGAWVTTDAGTEHFDDVVLACHSDQSLALLGDQATPAERQVLGAIGYHRNRALLHTDSSVLPTRRLAWAAWNYERASDGSREQAAVCLHYLINRLQPLPFRTPVIVSLNPVREPRAGLVHGEFDYAHPVFDAAAIAAQQRVPALQGVGGVWFCGAWTRYGFHEDGLMSGLAVVDALLGGMREGAVRSGAAAVAGAGCDGAGEVDAAGDAGAAADAHHDARSVRVTA